MFYAYNISFTAGGKSYSFSTTISYPHNFHDQELVKIAVMGEIGKYKNANGITDQTTSYSY